MFTLHGVPKNKDKFGRLIVFFKDVLDICHTLNIAPILEGSLAVFVYTENQEMDVNDVDLSCPEAEFPSIIEVLEEMGMRYEVKEWHVLQVRRDDLKVEFASTEHWLKDLPLDCEVL